MKKFLLFILLNMGWCWAEQPTIITSIAPYRFFVEKIAGDLVRVETIVPAMMNAHLYEPTPHEMESWKGAIVWIRSGDPFEAKLLPVLQKANPKLIILDLWKDLPLLSSSCRHSHERADPFFDRHIWLNPKLAQLQAKKIAALLSSAFPDKKEPIEQRLQLFLAELTALDQAIVQSLEPLKGKTILVSHPSFNYFCQEYGLKQLSVEKEGKEPLLKEVEELFAMAKKEKVCAVFSIPQFSSKGAKLLADKLHLPIHTINPYSEDYLKTMTEFVHLLSQ